VNLDPQRGRLRVLREIGNYLRDFLKIDRYLGERIVSLNSKGEQPASVIAECVNVFLQAILFVRKIPFKINLVKLDVAC
jgi:hypothetical protein